MIELSAKVGNITIKISHESEPYQKLSDAMHEIIEIEKALLDEDNPSNDFQPINRMKKI